MTRSSGGRTTSYVKSVSGPDPRPSVSKNHGFKDTHTYKIAGPMGDVFYMKNTSSIPTITKTEPHIENEKLDDYSFMQLVQPLFFVHGILCLCQ